MPKAGGTLTGGTGDVNPQWFRLAVQDNTLISLRATALVGISGTFPVPINRLGQKGEKVVVLEILKIRWQGGVVYPLNTAQSEYAERSLTAWLATSPPISGAVAGVISEPAPVPYNLVPTDGKVVDIYKIGALLAINNQTTDSLVSALEGQAVEWHDLTDGAGHGILIATDNLYLAAQSEGFDYGVAIGGTQVAANNGFSVNCDILYRFKEVTLKEYIGIVQSQQ